jgi:hypothetical protein
MSALSGFDDELQQKAQGCVKHGSVLSKSGELQAFV